MSKDAKDAKDRKDLESFILQHLSTHLSIPDSHSFLPSTPFAHLPPSLLTSCLQSLASSSLVSLSPLDRSLLVLTDEGSLYASRGTPEGQLLSHLRSTGGAASPQDLEAALGKDTLDIGRGKAMKDKWLQLDKDSGQLRLKADAAPQDTVREQLLAVQEGRGEALDAKVVQELKKRKMVQLRSVVAGHTVGVRGWVQ